MNKTREVAIVTGASRGIERPHRRIGIEDMLSPKVNA
jgi:hypothetical protein